MNYKGGRPKCVGCNIPLTNYRPGGRCKACWTIFTTGENHPRWTGGKKASKCQDCNIHIYKGQQRCWKCYQVFHRGKNHNNYREQPTSYSYIHQAIRKLISLEKCEHCGKEGKYIPFKYKSFLRQRWSIELANKTGKYLRDKSDWLALCKSCHRNYDFKNQLYQTPARLALS